MSFLNNLNIGGLIQQIVNAQPGQVADAAADHIGGMDTGELADHLATGAQNMDSGSVGSLASSILGALAKYGHDESTVHDAGIATDAAQSGDSDALTDLIAHAQQNPAALKDAAVDFIKNNPQAVEQFAPDFLKGIIGKFAS